MQIQLLLTGKTRFPFIQDGMEEYLVRIKRYTDFRIRELPDIRATGSWPQNRVMQEEGRLILKSLSEKDFVILLDERGKMMDSIGFAEFLERKHQDQTRRMVFVVGGAFGFSPEVYERWNMQLSLSRMTFSHQVVPLIFIEQLYRAFTIIRGAPYHHG
jgi:23S rRNA (pseudouridine1915-N3)-methyltransferase